MLAFCCDGSDCSNQIRVDPSAIVLPSGWIRVELEEGTGRINNPKQSHHLCPKCSQSYKQVISTTRQLT